MLKKTALSLFGLVAMLIYVNPPQAHAGVVIAIVMSAQSTSG